MVRQLVRSSSLRSVGYDKELNTLEVEFRDSGVYQYSDVPESVFVQLMSSSSIGKYFIAQIKDRYPTKKAR